MTTSRILTYCSLFVTLFIRIRGAGNETRCEDRSSCRGFNSSIFVGQVSDRNCFCDHLCPVYDDCCSDYRPDESIPSQSGPAFILPPEVISCQPISIKNYLKSKNGRDWCSSLDVYVVNKCPNGFKNEYVRKECEFDSNNSSSSGNSSNHAFHLLPVSGNSTKIIYRNLFCAVCNGDTEVEFWEMYYEDCPLTTNPTNTSECKKELVRPPSGVIPRLCREVIDRCAGNWTNISVESMCRRDGQTSYVYEIGGGHKTYRNSHCAVCNHVEETSCFDDAACPTEILSISPFGVGNPFDISFSIILDMNTGRQTLRTRASDGSDQIVQAMECKPGFVFDPFARICRLAFCQDGSSMVDGSGCEPEVVGPGLESPTRKLACPALVRLNETEFETLGNGSLKVHDTGDIYDVGDFDVNGTEVYVCPSYALNRHYNVSTEPVVTFKFDRIQGVLSFVGILLSLLSLSILLIVYAIFPSLRNIPGKCLISLVAALFVGQFAFLFVAPSDDDPIHRSLCIYLAIGMHYSFLAAFFWMNVMAFDICQTFSSQMARSSMTSSTSKRFRFYSVYAWLSPLTIILAAILANFLGSEDGSYRPGYGDGACWITNWKALVIFFALPLGIILFSNIVMFVITVHHIRRDTQAAEGAHQKSQSSARLVLYVKLSIIMGLTWVFGILAALTDWTPLWYAFIIFNTLQGVFIFVTFVMTKKVLRLVHNIRQTSVLTTTTSADQSLSKNSTKV